MALVLSSVVIALVSSTFLVQNSYYASQTGRTRMQDNARVVTEMIASEIRSAMRGGFVVAGARTLTIRSPIVVAILCERGGGGRAHIHSEGGEAAIDPAEVAGIAFRDASTGAWTYANDSWSNLNGGGTTQDAATRCADNGADTTGVSSEFHRLEDLDVHFSPEPVEGDVVMLFRETTFKIQVSGMDSTALGLFRGTYGGPLVEFATGIDATARFRYRRTGVGSFADTVTAAFLPDIDAVRIVADARTPASTGGQEDITFGWSVNVPLRNAR